MFKKKFKIIFKIHNCIKYNKVINILFIYFFKLIIKIKIIMSDNDKKKLEDKKGEYFTKWIQENFIPCGIVYSTDKSKEILKKNNLTPSEFIRPFGDLNKIPLKIQINNYNNVLTDFKIDFFDSENFDENENDLEYYLNNCLNHKKNITNLIDNNEKSIDDIIKKMNYYSFDYFNEMEKIIIEHCYFCESELFQQPFCSVYICSINDNIEAIENMKKKIPVLLIDTYETNISTLIIILNDKSNEDNYLKDNKIIQNNIKNIKSLFPKEEVLYFEINGCKEKNLDNQNLFNNYIHKLEYYGKYFSDNDSQLLEKGILLTKEEIRALKNSINVFFQVNFRGTIIKLIKTIMDNNQQKEKKILNLFYSKTKLVDCKYYETKKFLKPEKDLYLLCILLFYLRDYKNALFYLDKLDSKVKKSCDKLECAITQLKVILKYLNLDKKKNDFKDSLDLYINNKIYFTVKIPNKNKYYGVYRSFIILIKILEDFDLKEAIKIIDNSNDLFINFCCKLFQPLLFEKKSFYYLFFEKPNIKKFFFEILITTTECFNKNGDNSLTRIKYQLNELKYLFNILDFDNIKNPNYIFSFLQIKKFICQLMINYCKQLSYIDLNFKILCNNICLYQILENKIYDSNNSNSEENKIINDLFLELLNYFSNNDNFLKNYSIPKIDQSSLIVIKQHELIILKNKVPSNFYQSFSKYSIPLSNIPYSLLSNEDLYFLKLTDMITNKKQYGNYFINKEQIVNKNEEIIINFDLMNPLPINILAEDIIPIIDNEKLVEYEKIKISLEPNVKKNISLKIKFKEIGKITLLGIFLKIFNNIKIKSLFNYPLKHSYLYEEYDIRNEEHLIDYMLVSKKRKRRKFSAAHRINYKDKEKNYSFEILDKDININITVPFLNEGINLFQYELFYLPIKIQNNYRLKIKRFTIFLNCDTIISPNYIFHELDLNEEKIIRIPLIPKILGTNFLNIVIKFESLNEDIEIKSYILKIITHKSINIQVSDVLMEKEKLFEKRRIIFDFNLEKNDKFTKMVFDNNFQNLLIGNKLIKSYENDFKYSTNDRFYKEIEVILEDSDNKYNDKIFISEELIEEYNKNSYIFYIEKLLEKEKNIIYQFQLETSDKNKKNFLYLYHPINYREDMNYNDNYLKKILRESTQISYTSNLISQNENYIELTLKINVKPFIDFFKTNIFSVKIKINEESNNFIWIGLKENFISNFTKETEMKFSFIYFKDNLSIYEYNENELNINQFIYEITINPSLKTIIFTNILKPIYLPITFQE